MESYNTIKISLTHATREEEEFDGYDGSLSINDAPPFLFASGVDPLKVENRLIGQYLDWHNQ